MKPVVTLLVFVSILAMSAQAAAFSRSKTCGPPPNKFQCKPGEESKFVNWPSSCVVVHLDAEGTRSIDMVEVERVARLSLDVWANVECSFIQPIFGGFTNEDRVGFNTFIDHNANVLTFRDDFWPHSGNILALTSVTFDRLSGDIVDADIEFNTANFRFTSGETTFGTVIDLQNTLVHELGHLLGLDHSTEDEATMFASAPEGEILKRSLHPDDVAGLCEAYPLGSADNAPVCQRHTIGWFERSELAMTEAPEPECSAVDVRHDANRPVGWMGLCLLVLGFVGLRRRP